MRKLPTRMRLYIGAVLATALVAGAASFWTAARLPEEWHVTFVILFALAVVGQLHPVHVGLKVKVTPGDIATFAAALTLGPFLAMLVAAGGMALGLRFSRPRVARSWYNLAFNVAAAALGSGAAAFTFGSLARPGSPILAEPGAIVAAAVAKYVVNRELVDLAAALQMRRDPLANWWSVHRRDLAEQGTLYVLGAVAAMAAAWSPFSLVLFAAPMALFQVATSETARLRDETRAMIRQLADIVDLRDPYTHGHSERVAGYAERLARRMKMQPTQVELVREAARLHDIGKIGTEDHILRKPGPLTAEEQVEMRRHTEIGHLLLSRFSDMADVAELVHSHHERHDGLGYPRGRRASEMPLEQSLIAVADAYDAMTTDRPYRRALAWATARAELINGRGIQWHPATVDAFVAMMDEQPAATARVTAPGAPLTSPG